MSVNPVYSELALKSSNNLKSQSIVESRIAERDSDISRIIAIHSSGSVIGCEAVAGEIHYSGRALFCLVYENSEGKLVRSEYGVEFSHKAEEAGITPSMSASARITMENTELKQLNGSYILSAIASADIEVTESASYNYLSGGEGLICKTESSEICSRQSSYLGSFEVFEEFETVSIDKVLMHYQTAVLTDIQAGVGCIICDGAVNLSLVYLTDGEEPRPETLSKLCEFRFEIDADEVMPNMTVTGHASVGSAVISANVDAARGKSQITAEITVNAAVQAYEGVTINAVTDLYSVTNDIIISAESVKFTVPSGGTLFNEKYADTAIITDGKVLPAEIVGITGENLNLQTTKVGSGAFTVEGVVSALALIKDEEGKWASVTMELPFEKELFLEGVMPTSTVTVCGIAHGVSARLKKEQEVEMEASLKIFANVFDNEYISVIAEVTEGDELIKNSNAISVFLPESGDGLWDVAKRLGQPPDEVLKYNQGLEFPLKGDERIIFYRQEN